MTLVRWKKHSEETLKANTHFALKHDTFSIGEEKIERDYFYFDSSDTVIIVPVQSDGKIVLVNQYRYLFDQECLEFPMGGSKKGDVTLADAAARELAEETGCVGHISFIGSFAPLNATTRCRHHVFLAEQVVSDSGIHSKDATEEFERVSYEPALFEAHIRSGGIWDGPTLAAWALVRQRFLS